MKLTKKLLVTIGLSVTMILGNIIPAVAADGNSNIPKILAHDSKIVTINEKKLEINKIPELKVGKENAVELKEGDVYKEYIDGKILLHVVSVKPIIKTGYNIQDTQYGVSYTVNDYYQFTYMGTAELDTNWYTSGGNVTNITNYGWGSCPSYQWPDYWTNDGSSAYIVPGSPTQAISWANLTDHYSFLGYSVYHRTYHLQTNVNGNGGYSNSYYIYSEGY